MKIKSLLVVSILSLFCAGVMAEEAALVTGTCKDGTAYSGKSKRGACRGHGGVKEWSTDKAAAPKEAAPAPAAAAPAPVAPAPAAEPAAVAPAAAPAPAAASAPAPAPAAAVAKAEPPVKAKPATPPAGSGQVWVNTHSRIYHCEGSKFYGNTKEGEFMSEADAQAKGFVANRKKVCNK